MTKKQTSQHALTLNALYMLWITSSSVSWLCKTVSVVTGSMYFIFKLNPKAFVPNPVVFVYEFKQSVILSACNWLFKVVMARGLTASHHHSHSIKSDETSPQIVTPKSTVSMCKKHDTKSKATKTKTFSMELSIKMGSHSFKIIIVIYTLLITLVPINISLGFHLIVAWWKWEPSPSCFEATALPAGHNMVSSN